jgi:hypothetical protein
MRTIFMHANLCHLVLKVTLRLQNACSFAVLYACTSCVDISITAESHVHLLKQIYADAFFSDSNYLSEVGN